MIRILVTALTCMIIRSCDLHLFDSDEGSWYVKNASGETVVLSSNYYAYFPDKVIEPGEFGYIGSINFGPPGSAVFDRFYKRYDMLLDLVMTVSDTEGNVLKVWRESEKDFPDKQFFNERYWEKKEKPLDKGAVDYRWTFHIEESDTASPPSSEN